MRESEMESIKSIAKKALKKLMPPHMEVRTLTLEKHPHKEHTTCTIHAKYSDNTVITKDIILNDNTEYAFFEQSIRQMTVKKRTGTWDTGKKFIIFFI